MIYNKLMICVLVVVLYIILSVLYIQNTNIEHYTNQDCTGWTLQKPKIKKKEIKKINDNDNDNSNYDIYNRDNTKYVNNRRNKDNKVNSCGINNDIDKKLQNKINYSENPKPANCKDNNKSKDDYLNTKIDDININYNMSVNNTLNDIEDDIFNTHLNNIIYKYKYNGLSDINKFKDIDKNEYKNIEKVTLLKILYFLIENINNEFRDVLDNNYYFLLRNNTIAIKKYNSKYLIVGKCSIYRHEKGYARSIYYSLIYERGSILFIDLKLHGNIIEPFTK